MNNKTINIELSHEELKEIALGLNLLSAERNCYLLEDDNVKYRSDIEKYLNMDKELIRKVKDSIEVLKDLI
jgi:hypothetical protein